MCEAGVNIKAIQAILGHSNSVITLNIYADATKEMNEKAIKDVNDFFQENKVLLKKVI